MLAGSANVDAGRTPGNGMERGEMHACDATSATAHGGVVYSAATSLARGFHAL
jgi:hypothetical protein